MSSLSSNKILMLCLQQGWVTFTELLLCEVKTIATKLIKVFVKNREKSCILSYHSNSQTTFTKSVVK